MAENLNEKPNSKEFVAVKPKAVSDIWRGEYTGLVSFITESKVYRLADTAKIMRYLATRQVVESLDTGSRINFDGCTGEVPW